MKSISKTFRTQGFHLTLGAVIILISAAGGAAKFITQEQAQAQYGTLVRQMQKDAAVLVSHATTGHAVTSHTGQSVPPKYCPAARASLGEESLLRNGLSEASLKIFVSFSMSDEALKSLAASLSKLKTGSLVMRGLYQNSFQKTAFKLKELGISVTLDPEAFERFHVTSVPQFVLFHDTRVHGAGAFDTLRGNVSLEFALSQFAGKGDLASVAKSLLMALREKP